MTRGGDGGDVLGMPLELAEQMLADKGISYTLKQTSSRKGSGGSDARVVRCKRTQTGLELTWALFVSKEE